MKIKLTHFAIFNLALFLTSCESEKLKELRDRSDYYTKQIILYTERVEKAETRVTDLNERLEATTERAGPSLKSILAKEKMLAEMREFIEGLPTLEESVQEKSALMQAYEKSFQERSIAIGTTFNELKVANGATYQNAVLREFSPEKIKISHSSGFTDIPFSSLSEQIRAQFIFKPQVSPTADPASTLKRKPAFLKSNQEHAAERQMEISQINAERQSELEKQNQNEIAQRQKMAEESKSAEAKEKLMAEYTAKRSQLQRQIAELQSAISMQESRKGQVISSASLGNIRPSASNLEKLGRPYDLKIDQFSKQISEIEAEISRLVQP